jgi:hypothetical protein
MDKLIISSYTKIIIMIGIRRTITLLLIFLLFRIENTEQFLTLKIEDVISLFINARVGEILIALSSYAALFFISISFVMLINKLLEKSHLGKKYFVDIQSIKEAENKFEIPFLSEEKIKNYRKRKSVVLTWFDMNILITSLIFFITNILGYSNINFLISSVYLLLSMYILNFYYLSHLSGYNNYVSKKLGRKISLSEYIDLEKYL